MQKLINILIFSILSFSAFAGDNVRIKMDNEHLQLQRADGTSPLMYSFGPTNSLEIDSSSYKLVAPEALSGKSANSIQLIFGKNQQYSAIWHNGQSFHQLSEKTLTPNPGSSAFSGFLKGQRGAIAVGYKDGNDFSVFWVGMFNVE